MRRLPQPGLQLHVVHGERGDQRGFTLIEALVAVVLTAVGLGGVLLTANRAQQLQQTTSTYRMADNACREFLERFRSGDLAEQFRTYVAAPNFTAGDLHVTVTFPTDVLTQTLGTVPTTARFRDLNNDGLVELNTASTDVASLLPVRLMVWRGSFRMEVASLVTDR